MVMDKEKGFLNWAEDKDPTSRVRYSNMAEAERLGSAAMGGLLTAAGLRRRGITGALVTLAGGFLIYRSASGVCPVYEATGFSTARDFKGDYGVPEHRGIHVDESLVFDQSPEQLFKFWRDFENLPLFMNHLESVKSLGNDTSHWVAKGPVGTKVSWDAEIVDERENEFIRWRSLPHSQVENEGTVHFSPVAGGTELRVQLDYLPPAGALGAAVARLFGEEPSLQVRDDLENLKDKLESGDIVLSQPSPTFS